MEDKPHSVIRQALCDALAALDCANDACGNLIDCERCPAARGEIDCAVSEVRDLLIRRVAQMVENRKEE
jgi:hypothetical protein